MGSVSCAILNSVSASVGSRSPGWMAATAEKHNGDKAETDGTGKGADEGDGEKAETGGTGEGTGEDEGADEGAEPATEIVAS